MIHPTAIIDPQALLAENVTVGPYSIIGPHVRISEGAIIHPHVVIDGYTTIGARTEIWPGAVIGSRTQDLKFKGEVTYVSIGESCQIRECVTINSSCGEGSTVSVGNNCLIMAYSHIAHNCEVGNNVILANNATLAGHVIVEDFAIIGGLSAIHQFARVGCHAMVGGMSRVTHDVPPYTIGAGVPYKLGGINIVGLKRRNFSLEVRLALAKSFKCLYRSTYSVNEALEHIEQDYGSIEEVRHLVDFCRSSQRGIISDAKSGREQVED